MPPIEHTSSPDRIAGAISTLQRESILLHARKNIHAYRIRKFSRFGELLKRSKLEMLREFLSVPLLYRYPPPIRQSQQLASD